MKLIKYDNFWNDPFAEFDSLFDRVFRDRGLLPGYFNGEEEAMLRRGFRVDSFASEDDYRVVAELPGVPREAIDVKLENAVLTVSGEHEQGEGDKRRRFQFSRSVTVGDDIDAEKVSAKFENGLLTVVLPKREERKPRAITVH